MNNTSNETCAVKHDIDQFLFPFIYTTVFILSLPANLVSLYVAYLQVTKGNELGVYLFSLSLADLLYTLTLPLWIDFALQHDNWKHGQVLCIASTFLMYTNFYSSATFLSCISLDRYLAVVYPLRFSQLRTNGTAVMVSSVIWIIQIGSNSVILWKGEVSSYTDQRRNDTDEFCYDRFPLEPWQAILNIFRVVLGFIFPLTVMAVSYLRIYKAIKHNQATQDHEKGKIKQLLLGIIITFFLCFTPFHVVLFIRSVLEVGNCAAAKLMFNPYKITLALTSFNCIADPILYSFVSETARSDMKKAFPLCWRAVKWRKPVTDKNKQATFKQDTEMELL